MYLCFAALLPLYINSKVTHNSCQQLKHDSMPRSNCVKKNHKKTTNLNPIHFLTQIHFLFVSWALCDRREIKILAMQSHSRKAELLPPLPGLSNSTSASPSAASLGNHIFPLDSHSSNQSTFVKFPVPSDTKKQPFCTCSSCRSVRVHHQPPRSCAKKHSPWNCAKTLASLSLGHGKMESPGEG